LKIDKFLAFVTSFYRSVSPAAASAALARVALLYFWVNLIKVGFTQGWRELSVLSGRIRRKLKKILTIST